jgi:hypothetical protein
MPASMIEGQEVGEALIKVMGSEHSYVVAVTLLSFDVDQLRNAVVYMAAEIAAKRLEGGAARAEDVNNDA